MLVLGIESTCDETACALVKGGREIVANIVSSQASLHSRYGGVVPELSCRRHVEVLIPLLKETLQKAGVALSAVELIAVAHAPGLIGALLLGVTAAKALSLALNIPFLGVNHVEAHLYAALMSNETTPSYPCLGVVASGGHTALWRMTAIGSYTLVGQTVDDAIGEAFDKVAKLLELPYPGGPHIEALAREGDATRFPLRGGRIKERPLDFSFSGLKTAVLYILQKKTSWSHQEKADLAASFQAAAFNDIIDKVMMAAERAGYNDIILGGGVTNNVELRRLLSLRAPHLRCFWPTRDLSLDNAAMIAGLAYHHFLLRGGRGDTLTLAAATRLPLG